METPTWNAITSVYNMRIILTLLMQITENESLLQPYSSKIESYIGDSNIKTGLN